MLLYSANANNLSGRQGVIGWLNGCAKVELCDLTSRTDGQQNADLTTGFLEQLSTFFSQPRYINLVTMVLASLVSLTVKVLNS